MKSKVIQLLVILFLFLSTQVHSNTINKINFIGLNISSELDLLNSLTFKVGHEFSSNKSDQIIQELFQTGYFSNISISKNNDELNINLVENPYIKFFDIEQVKLNPWKNWVSPQELFSNEVLFEYLKENNLNTGEIYSQDKFDNFLSYLENSYSSAGFFNADISHEIEKDSENRVTINLKINQGTKVSISSLKISGSSFYDENTLLDILKIGESDNFILNMFTKKDEYSKSKFDQGIKALNEYYINSGFLDFKIINVLSDISSDNKKISFEIQISEGTQFKMGDISFSGELGNQTEEYLKSTISINKGDIFNRQIVVDDIQKIIDIYSDQGYAFVDINPLTDEFLDNINLKFNVSLNKKVYINRISIFGNTRTQDEVIRREISISEGGLYSRSELKKSILKLRRLGYFSDVQMDVLEIENSPDKLNLVFNVEETKTGSISSSISHSNNYGISIGAGIKEKNVFGTGNTLNADFKFAQSYNRSSFYFENPYFNENAHSISYGAFFSELKDDDIMKDSYEISSKGLTIGYGVPVTENTRVNLGFEFSDNDVKCGTNFATINYESKQCAVTSNDEFKASLNWTQSSLNDYMYPTDGSSNSIKFDVAIPPGDHEYFKVNFDYMSYKELSKNITLKLNSGIGVASGYGSKELPFYKRFFGGGSGSVRGFGNKSLGPLYANNKAKGGELSILGSASLIAPADFFSDNKNMRVSAFIDAGNIYESTSNVKLSDIRMSTGLGFAYLSPIGPIGFYWSTPLMKKSGDIIENFSFTIGTGF